MTRLIDRAVMLALGLAIPVVLSAAQTAAQSDEEELREVIVTARSLEVTTPLELSELGYDVEFVSGQQVKDHGFVDTAQAIEMLVPGAYVATQMGAFSYINMSLQGSRNGDVLWTMDGVRINNRLYNGTSPADTLPAGMIERVEVLKAGQGLLYGTQAIAGVVNVVTRAFSDETDAGVGVGVDSNSGMHINGYARGALGNHRFVAWASQDETDGFQLYDVMQPNSTTRDRQYDVKNFGLKYGYEFTDSARLTITGVHTDAALDYPNVSYTDVNDRDEDILSARLDYTPSEDTEFYLKGYFHDWDTDYYPATDPADSAFWGYKDVGISAATKLGLTRGLDWLFGYDFQRYEGRDEVLLIEEQTESVHAVYAQIRSTDELSASTHFTAGLRYNHADGSDATVWSLSGIHRFSDALYIEASAGTSFLLPDAYQLYAIDPFDTRGNPNLKPEESLAFNLAIGGQFAGSHALAWQVSVWDRSIDNLIVDDDTNPPPGFDTVFINIDEEVKVSGAELLLRGPITDDWSFDASYMYSREHARGTSTQLDNRPLNSAKLGVSFAPVGGRFGADLALKYFGDTRTSVTGFGVQHYGDAIIANLGGHLFLDSGNHHRIGVRVENLFDTDYETRIRSAVLAGSAPTRFMYRNQGAPITGFLNYSYTF
jgi:outer membrane cobalamin receptor